MVTASRRLATRQHRTEKKSGLLPCRRLSLLALIVVSCLASIVAAASLTVKDLLAHGERYHQQAVSLTGAASGIKSLTGPRNLPFYTFTLRDSVGSADEVTVIMQGKPEVTNDDYVYVYGIFIKSRKAGRTTISNRIEATIVEPLYDQRLPLIG